MQVRVQAPAICKDVGIMDVERFKASLSKMLRSSVLEVLEDKAVSVCQLASSPLSSRGSTRWITR